MTIELGSMLATHYRVVRVIGEGGMGIVVEAVHDITERRVAIKQLLPHLARNQEAVSRLLNEATAACRSRHPNVIEIYDVIPDGGTTLLVMELLEGESLRDVLERGKLPARELIERLIPAMRGVAEAHRKGVVHRDIHPGNIFLARSSAPGGITTKVLDFGICKLEQPAGDHFTRGGTTMGIPRYMSYEQLTNASGVDARSDVYSFGIVLYEALTGRVPYKGGSYAELAIAMFNHSREPLRVHSPDIPEPLAHIVERATAYEREQRTENLDQLADELSEYLAQQDGVTLTGRASIASSAPPAVSARSASALHTLPTGSAPPALAASQRRRWTGLALAGALLALGAALATHTFAGSSSANRQVRPEPARLEAHAPELETSLAPSQPNEELPLGREPLDSEAAGESAPAESTGELAALPANGPAQAVVAAQATTSGSASTKASKRSHRASKRPVLLIDFH